MDKIRKGDEVVVIAGKDKGRKGTVLSRVNGDYVLIEGINQVKKHAKPNPVKGIVGGVITKNMPLHASNVALFNPETKKADRVGFKFIEDAQKKQVKVRIFKSTGKAVGE